MDVIWSAIPVMAPNWPVTRLVIPVTVSSRSGLGLISDSRSVFRISNNSTINGVISCRILLNISKTQSTTWPSGSESPAGWLAGNLPSASSKGSATAITTVRRILSTGVNKLRISGRFLPSKPVLLSFVRTSNTLSTRFLTFLSRRINCSTIGWLSTSREIVANALSIILPNNCDWPVRSPIGRSIGRSTGRSTGKSIGSGSWQEIWWTWIEKGRKRVDNQWNYVCARNNFNGKFTCVNEATKTKATTMFFIIALKWNFGFIKLNQAYHSRTNRERGTNCWLGFNSIEYLYLWHQLIWIIRHTPYGVLFAHVCCKILC